MKMVKQELGAVNFELNQERVKTKKLEMESVNKLEELELSSGAKNLPTATSLSVEAKKPLQDGQSELEVFIKFY